MPWSASMRIVSLMIGIVFLFGGEFRVLAADAKPIFRAGAATSNITPPLGELIVGGWQPIPATNIHDELHAHCLVLDDGKVQLAIVICDNVGIPVEVYDLAKQQIHEVSKSRSQALQTFIIQLAGPGSYVPSERAARGGGYSAIVESNKVGSEGGQVLTERTVEAIKSLWPGN